MGERKEEGTLLIRARLTFYPLIVAVLLKCKAVVQLCLRLTQQLPIVLFNDRWKKGACYMHAHFLTDCVTEVQPGVLFLQ